MAYNEKTIDILNDLVKINNDRIEGYEKAIKNSIHDSHYDELFNSMIQQSNDIRQELSREIQRIGGEPEIDSTTNSGKIYRTWMDVKAAFTGNSEKSVLELCEFGEDAAQKAYKEALSASEDIPEEIRELLLRQKNELKESHDMIKEERDRHQINS
ncbi:MAG: PA2169 family four-helix-bundle protein [Ginsengibacter sp.]